MDLDDAQALLDRITRPETSALLRLALADEFAATFGQELIILARRAPIDPNRCPWCDTTDPAAYPPGSWCHSNPPHPWHYTPKKENP